MKIRKPAGVLAAVLLFAAGVSGCCCMSRSAVKGEPRAVVPEGGLSQRVAILGHGIAREAGEERVILDMFVAEMAKKNLEPTFAGSAGCLRRGPAVVPCGRFNAACAVDWGRQNNTRWVIQIHRGIRQRIDVYFVDASTGGIVFVKKTHGTVLAIRDVVSDLASSMREVDAVARGK